MIRRFWIVSFLMTAVLFTGASGIELIKNGSFEHNFKTDGNVAAWPKADFWTFWGTGSSGVENTGFDSSAQEGAWRAWVSDGGTGLTQVADYTVKAGDIFTLSFYVNAKAVGRGYEAQLFYLDGTKEIDIPGWTLAVTADADHSTWEHDSAEWIAQPGQSYIGKTIGVRLRGLVAWQGLDSVSLTVTTTGVILIAPPDGASMMPLDTILQWQVLNDWNCNVYFGTSPDGAANPQVISDQLATEYDTGTLQPGTHYYWQVDAIDPQTSEVVSGDVWSFITMSDAPDIKYQTNWPPDVTRNWAGPEFWLNTLYDWRIANGRLECLRVDSADPGLTAHLLNGYLNDQPGDFIMTTRMGALQGDSTGALGGFLIASGSNLANYKTAAVIHHAAGPGAGFWAGANGHGQAVIRDMTGSGYPVLAQGADPGKLPGEVLLKLSGQYLDECYTLTVQVLDGSDVILSQASFPGIEPTAMRGNIGLVSHYGNNTATGVRYWFQDFAVGGDKISIDDQRCYGPIMGVYYTLSNDIMKMTAQMFPLGTNDTTTATLEVMREDAWTAVQTQDIITPACTATFRVPQWDSTRDHAYRVRYDLKSATGQAVACYEYGTIRHDPVEKDSLKLGAFTCIHNMGNNWTGINTNWVDYPNMVWIPHEEVKNHVAWHQPDLLFFSGDNVYEGGTPIRIAASPQLAENLDYLYVWYCTLWSFGELTREIPAIFIPDDHDVRQGNLWGEGGKYTSNQTAGGYTEAPEFVNLVQRTQSAHLPDPYDPTPVLQDISVYYTNLNWGRVSFAILEDRKFKNGYSDEPVPTGAALAADPLAADLPHLKLLGERQLEFIEYWAADWQGIDMKATLSQTLWSNLHTHTNVALNPSGPDFDSNGWPQSGRNRALKAIRKAFAVHVCGDQHLGTLNQYGVDDWDDSPWVLCVPAVGNAFPRAWSPSYPPVEAFEGMPSYTGKFYDRMNNRITVWAAANPFGSTGWTPPILHDRRTGYGMVTFDKVHQTIKFECWPRYPDPADPATGGQYAGWPKTVDMSENYGRKALGYLPEVTSAYLTKPVVQVVKEDTGEIIYTRRILTPSFKAKVFERGAYTVHIGEPGTDQWESFTNLQPSICGEWGFAAGDINQDCVTDMTDLLALISKWLNCSLPNNPDCTNLMRSE